MSIGYWFSLCSQKKTENVMTNQEQKLLEQFEKDLEKTIGSYLNKRNNTLMDGNNHIYVVKNVVRNSLFVPKRDQHKLDVLVEYLKSPTTTQPSIEGYISLNIKGAEDVDYSVRVYFFEIYTSHYHVNIKEDIDLGKPNHYDVALSHVEYFEEQKYRLY